MIRAILNNIRNVKSAVMIIFVCAVITLPGHIIVSFRQIVTLYIINRTVSLYSAVNSFKTASGISVKGDSSSVAAQAMFKTVRRYSRTIPPVAIHTIIEKSGWTSSVTGIWI